MDNDISDEDVDLKNRFRVETVPEALLGVMFDPGVTTPGGKGAKGNIVKRDKIRSLQRPIKCNLEALKKCSKKFGSSSVHSAGDRDVMDNVAAKGSAREADSVEETEGDSLSILRVCC